MMTLLLEMGLITPPVGLNVFVISRHSPGCSYVYDFSWDLAVFLWHVLCMFLLIVFRRLPFFCRRPWQNGRAGIDEIRFK